MANGLVRKDAYVKVLARGEISTKVNVHAHAVSKTAEAAITDAGGTVTLVELPVHGRRPCRTPGSEGQPVRQPLTLALRRLPITIT